MARRATKTTSKAPRDDFKPIGLPQTETKDFILGTFTAKHPLRIDGKSRFYAVRRKAFDVYEQVGDNMSVLIVQMQNAQQAWDKVQSGEINGFVMPPHPAQQHTLPEDMDLN